ncbi:MAG: ComEC/Rec2 family competence protein, partial [Clostridia bacterium]|nr:ComEC/Rec2 family competence protein [Clostridia bacterium]
AVLGLLIFSPRAAKYLRVFCSKLPWIAAKPLEFFGTTLVMTACAQIFTLPLLAVHMGYISLVSVLTNMLAYWVVALLFLLGWVALGFSFVWLPAALIVSVPLQWLASALTWIVRSVAEIPFAVLGTDHWLVRVWIWCTSGLIAYVLLRPRLRNFAWASAAVVFGLVAVMAGIRLQAAKTMEVVALDVGYGRCIVITCGEDTVVVDCGSTRSGAGKALKAHLKTRNIDEIDLLIVSVNKPHHTNGLADLLPMTRRMAVSTEFGDRALGEAICAAGIAAGTEILPLSEGIFALNALEVELFVPPAMAADASAAVAVRSAYGAVTVLSDHTELSLHRLMQNDNFGESDVLVCADHAIKFRMQREIVMKMQAEYVIICSNYVADTPDDVRNTARDGTIRLCLTE